MKTRVLLVLAVGLLLAADKPKENAKGDQAKIQGAWTVVSAERGGQAQEDAKEATLTFKGNNLTAQTKDKTHKGTFKLDPGKKPKHIDIMPTDGDQKGKTFPGIYSLEGGQLRICFNTQGETRPAKFEAKDDGVMLLVLKPAKK